MSELEEKLAHHVPALGRAQATWEQLLNMAGEMRVISWGGRNDKTAIVIERATWRQDGSHGSWETWRLCPGTKQYEKD